MNKIDLKPKWKVFSLPSYAFVILLALSYGAFKYFDSLAEMRAMPYLADLSLLGGNMTGMMSNPIIVFLSGLIIPTLIFELALRFYMRWVRMRIPHFDESVVNVLRSAYILRNIFGTLITLLYFHNPLLIGFLDATAVTALTVILCALAAYYILTRHMPNFLYAKGLVVLCTPFLIIQAVSAGLNLFMGVSI